jgi:TnpA family transposase
MLRVVLSIQAGRLTPSTILRRLGSYSRKNKLYQAFRELGRAIRTEYLLGYVADEQLRSSVLVAMNKNESFNHFTQWLAFGGEGVIAENNRDEQRKVIKYNHLVANCVIFYNVHAVSQLLRSLKEEGYKIEPDVLAALSPYITQHINRFGLYTLDTKRRPPALDYRLFPG